MKLKSHKKILLLKVQKTHHILNQNFQQKRKEEKNWHQKSS